MIPIGYAENLEEEIEEAGGIYILPILNYVMIPMSYKIFEEEGGHSSKIEVLFIV